jgi:hypothetical protein
MSLSKPQVREYRQLKDSGVAVTEANTVAFNEGSETSVHITAKSLAGLIGLRNGYRVDSEVEITNQPVPDGECDILLWGHDTRLTYAVECDHSFTQEKKQRKKQKYVDHTAIDDIQYLDLNEMPAHIVDGFGWVGSELGLPA